MEFIELMELEKLDIYKIRCKLYKVKLDLLSEIKYIDYRLTLHGDVVNKLTQGLNKNRKYLQRCLSRTEFEINRMNVLYQEVETIIDACNTEVLEEIWCEL